MFITKKYDYNYLSKVELWGVALIISNDEKIESFTASAPTKSEAINLVDQICNSNSKILSTVDSSESVAASSSNGCICTPDSRPCIPCLKIKYAPYVPKSI